MNNILGLKSYLKSISIMIIVCSFLLLDKSDIMLKVIMAIIAITLISFFSVFIIVKEEEIIIYSRIIKKRIIPRRTLKKVSIKKIIGRRAPMEIMFIQFDDEIVKYKTAESRYNLPKYAKYFQNKGIDVELISIDFL